MSTSALSTPTKPNEPSSMTIWRHLLWKDFRQVRQVIFGVAIIEACLQLIVGMLESLFPEMGSGFSVNCVNIALASPTLVAIACSGVLIGQERQTGCWTWSSSLPVSWRQSIASKTFVWFAASLVTTLLLLAVAALELAINHNSINLELFASDDPARTQLMTLIVGVQVFVFLSMATMLVKDTLMAIVIAATGLLAFHLQSLFVNDFYHRSIDLWVLLTHVASIFVGGIGFVITYRWRWGTGQYTQASAFSNARFGNARPNRVASRALSHSLSQPSELGMLFQHGLSSSSGLRTTVFLSAICINFFADMPWEANSIFAVAASCVLGISVFAGEQTLNRYRFFADRGVCWKKLLVSHVALPALMTLVLAGCTAISLPWHRELPEFWVACISAFIVGMFSSLVFSNSIISSTAAFAAMLGGLFFCRFASVIWNVLATGYPFAIEIWFPVSGLLVLTVAIRQISPWLIKDRFVATGTYFTTIVVAGPLPGLLGFSLGFLLIPNIPWDGAPIEQIRAVDWTGGPDLTAWSGAIEFQPSDKLENGSAATESTDDHWDANILPPTWTIVNDPTWTASPDKLLRAIEDGGVKPASFDYVLSANLESMIKSSAVLAAIATHNRQKEDAIRFWKANRKLLAFCQQPALQTTTLRPLLDVWRTWDLLSDDDLRFLAETADLSELMPFSLSSDQFREVLRARASLRRRESRYTELEQYYRADRLWNGATPLHVYPPIQWAYERQLALALSEDLRFSSLPINAIWNRTFLGDPLVGQYSQLKILEFSVRQRKSCVRQSPAAPENE